MAKRRLKGGQTYEATKVRVQTQERADSWEACQSSRLPYGIRRERRMYLGTKNNASKESMSNANSMVFSLCFISPMMPGDKSVSRIHRRTCDNSNSREKGLRMQSCSLGWGHGQ